MVGWCRIHLLQPNPNPKLLQPLRPAALTPGLSTDYSVSRCTCCSRCERGKCTSPLPMSSTSCTLSSRCGEVRVGLRVRVRVRVRARVRVGATATAARLWSGLGLGLGFVFGFGFGLALGLTPRLGLGLG